jgi:hypothetical protein
MSEATKASNYLKDMLLMPFRAAREKGTGGRGRQQRRVSIPGIGAATAFARLIEMPEPVLGPHGTIEGASLGFSLLRCASTCGADIRRPITA